MVALLCAPCGSLSSDLTPCESGIAEDLWLFFNPSRYVVPFALSPTHYVDLPPTSVVICISCSLCFAHSCHVWFSSYYPTLLRTGRSVPSSRPHHASGPLTHNPGHVLTRPSRSRTRITSPQWPAGYALHHGPESRSAAHVTAATTPLMVTASPGLVAVTSPPSARPAHAPHDARAAHGDPPPGSWLPAHHATSTHVCCCTPRP